MEPKRCADAERVLGKATPGCCGACHSREWGDSEPVRIDGVDWLICCHLAVALMEKAGEL